ncbi:Coatomer subunit epsilon-1, partial [Camellia lanceoleosa]
RAECCTGIPLSHHRVVARGHMAGSSRAEGYQQHYILCLSRLFCLAKILILLFSNLHRSPIPAISLSLSQSFRSSFHGGTRPVVRPENNFYLGAYQAAINNSDVPSLSPEDAIERTVSFTDLILPSVATRSIQSAATPLQAVKLLALYLTSPNNKVKFSSSFLKLQFRVSMSGWQDPAIGNNPILRLIAGIIFRMNKTIMKLLKHTNVGGTMELHALNVQIFLKMHRSDYMENRSDLIFQDFSEKYQMTSLILNGKAGAACIWGNFDEA